jgi:glycosyl hydrolase family 59/glycosyl hydrolase family 59 (putative galactocerebrosidase)
MPWKEQVLRSRAALVTVVLGGVCALAAPAVGASVPAGAASGGVASHAAAAGPRPAALPSTSITVNGNGGGRVYGGAGAVLGGGGVARYLEEYPAAQRTKILDYLFKPGYGASLQLLKLEITGDGGTAAGSEPSVEHSRGHINCGAGYEFAIARQAVAINPKLKLAGLQWGAPGWVSGTTSLFTPADIGYLLDWLGCAKRLGLTVSYLGGWDEADNGSHSAWFHSLRQALDSHGYRGVQIVAADGVTDEQWEYLHSPDVAILGPHNNCGYPTGKKQADTKCFGNAEARRTGKPMWGSELGGMSGGGQKGCKQPCASAVDRAFIREYVDARVTADMVWPALVAMPASVLRYANRGMVTANQPWSGNFRVNAETWAMAHFTQFAWPPTQHNPGGWKFVGSASGFLRGNRVNGSYMTLVRSTRDEWSTIIETTAGVTGSQLARFTVTGGRGLAGKTVHVWASDFSQATGKPSRWFARQRDIKPVHGTFTLTVKPGYVYSLTTTTGQGKGTAGSPPASPLRLPYHNNLASGQGEPTLLAPEDGSFELAPCQAPDGAGTCTKQTTAGQPVLWSPGPLRRHPYAVIGDDWRDYTVSVDAMVPRSGSAGLIARFHSVSTAHGAFTGYLFDVNTNGNATLTRSNGGQAVPTVGAMRLIKPPELTTLARARVSFAPGSWHRLSLTVSGSSITAAVDGQRAASLTDSSIGHGAPGIETGGWYPAFFSNLSVTSN